MRNIVTVEHPIYGKTHLDVNKVIAMVPERHELLFEAVRWILDEENYNIVYREWVL